MNAYKFSEELFLKVPIVGIIRGMSDHDVTNILKVYHEAGLTTIEITMNTTGAEDMIKLAVEKYAGKLNIGAGTVCSEQDLQKALNAGAQFIVTPVINAQVIKTAVDKGIPVIPGAYTPTEIYNAWSLGAYMVKIFPATALGPNYIKDVKAPLNQIKLMPTGGVSIDNILKFKAAGADGYGMGSQLFDKAHIKDQNWEGLKAHLQEFVKKLNPEL